MGEREGDIFNSHLAESNGDVVHPDDVAPQVEQPDQSADDFYASSIAAAEMIDEEYTAETFGKAFSEIRQFLEDAKEISNAEGSKDIIIDLGEDRDKVTVGHYLATDVYEMFQQGAITHEGYDRLVQEYGTFARKKPLERYESGQATYTDYQSAAANDRLE